MLFDPEQLADEQHVQIDVAALYLDVGKFRAYQLARADGWHVQPGKPRGYRMSDIRKTAQRRAAAKPEGTP